MHSDPDWAKNAQQFQQTLGDTWSRAWAEAVKPLQGLDLGTPAAGMGTAPKINFSPTKLQALQKQYLEESAALWNQSMDASALAKDKRFSAKAWTENPLTAYTAAAYLLTSRTLMGLADAVEADDKTRARIQFAVEQWMAASAPSNYLAMNADAQKKLIDTQGESLAKGLQNLMHDMQQGHVSMTDESAFEVGRNLAVTPGAVMFENELMQVIQYHPSTQTVHRAPLLMVPPCINKFYILDLTARKSLVKYLTDQGYTVFITSWKNPTAEMAETRFDDYLLQGVDAVVKAAQTICQVPQVHLVGYCIGGTLTTTYLAWANRHYGSPDKVPVAHATLFTTLTDFSRPGDIEVFIDEAGIAWLEESMAKKGYLDGAEMGASFRLLRSNSLIWHYFVHSYLYGEPVPPFDVLFWNVDTTRMPRAMHAYYLREMYLHNNLVKRDALTLAGHPIDLDRVVQPLYMVTAEDDHIAPWRQCYRLRRYVSGSLRFVLSTSGHILGIVNPPVQPPKRSFWVGEPGREDRVEDWRDRADEQQGSWWEDWNAWLAGRTGELVAPPGDHPDYLPLCPAPGTYVLEK